MSTETANETPGADELTAKLRRISELTGISGPELLALLETEDQGDSRDDEAAPPDGQWLCIAFMGHNEYTGYVTEIVKNGQPAYHVDLPEKLWGGNPLNYVEYAASAWFSDRPVTEEYVRRQWESRVKAAAERARQEAEWRRMQEQRAIGAGNDEDLDDEDDPF